jgi:Protein of unknown function (DUF3253)
MTWSDERATIRQQIMAQVIERGIEKTICPSEVARAIGGEEWRSLMPMIREIGAELLAEGLIDVTQKGNPVHPLTAKGPIRFRITPRGLKS